MGLFSKESPEEKQAFIDLLTKWTGSKPTEKLELDFHVYKESMLYAQRNILDNNENVLAFIGADYGKLETYKIAGILLITDNRLLYVHKDRKSQFKQEWKFNKINGVTESGFPLKYHEFQIEIGKSKVVFHRVKKKDRYIEFIKILQDKINNPTTTQPKGNNKYSLLEQIAKLKEQGILTEEEFKQEKEKILNN